MLVKVDPLPRDRGKNHKNIWVATTQIWVLPKIRGGPPKWMVKIMETPINPWMIWGENPLFSETSIYHTCILLLMVQKSCTSRDVQNHVNNELDKLPTSTGEFTGFLNHQQYGLGILSSISIIPHGGFDSSTENLPPTTKAMTSAPPFVTKYLKIFNHTTHHRRCV